MTTRIIREEIKRTSTDIFNDSAFINPSNKYTWFEKPKLRVNNEIRNAKPKWTLITKIVWLRIIQQIAEKTVWKIMILSCVLRLEKIKVIIGILTPPSNLKLKYDGES